MSFATDVQKFADKTENKLDSVAKALLFKLIELTVTETPSVTGRARGGWVASYGSPSSSQGSPDKSGQRTITAAKKKAEKAVGKVYYLTNNVIYIRVLEYGEYPGVGPRTVANNGGIYSQLAPSGMVRKSVEAMKGYLSAEINRIGKK